MQDVCACACACACACVYKYAHICTCISGRGGVEAKGGVTGGLSGFYCFIEFIHFMDVWTWSRKAA